MSSQEIIQILTGTLGSLGFSVLFNIRGTKLLIAALGGTLSWSVYLLLSHWLPSDGTCYFLSAAIITVYAEVFARVVKTPTTTFLVPAIVPGIPGGALYYAMHHALNKQWDLFSQKALTALQIALALAMGIIVVTTMTRLLIALLRKVRHLSLDFHH